MINYADQAAKHFELERQEQIAIDWRTEFLMKLARQQLDIRMRRYPKSYQLRYNFYLDELHRDLCLEDLDRAKHIGLQRHHLRLAHAYSTEAQRLGHYETGMVHAT